MVLVRTTLLLGHILFKPRASAVSAMLSSRDRYRWGGGPIQQKQANAKSAVRWYVQSLCVPPWEGGMGMGYCVGERQEIEMMLNVWLRTEMIVDLRGQARHTLHHIVHNGVCDWPQYDRVH